MKAKANQRELDVRLEYTLTEFEKKNEKNTENKLIKQVYRISWIGKVKLICLLKI